MSKFYVGWDLYVDYILAITMPSGECKSGYFGPNCTLQCPPNTYGNNCAGSCTPTCAVIDCHHIYGCKGWEENTSTGMYYFKTSCKLKIHENISKYVNLTMIF